MFRQGPGALTGVNVSAFTAITVTTVSVSGLAAGDYSDSCKPVISTARSATQHAQPHARGYYRSGPPQRTDVQLQPPAGVPPIYTRGRKSCQRTCARAHGTKQYLIAPALLPGGASKK